jgi:hypothetical protein
VSIAYPIEYSSTKAPLDLTIHREGLGGVTGQSPTVALRDAGTVDRYLDWFDNAFKTTGWTTKYNSMLEVERGHYQRLVDLSLLTPAVTPGMVLAAEFRVNNGVDVIGDALDLLILVNTATDLALLRKLATNRLEEYPGNPGQLILFDDDAVTPLRTWQLRDASGGPIVSTVGAPARRTAAT